jgi:hypothetical protein
MIRQIVFFTARDPADLGRIVEGLELLGQIPHSEHFEVVQNAKVDQFGNDVDVIVYAEFADAAALVAYKAHPIYAEATRRVRPLRELRYAADFKALEKKALKRSA